MLCAHCVLCGAESLAGRLCAGCAAALPRMPIKRCDTCALPLPSGRTCGPCLTHPPYYDRITAAMPYAFPVDALVQSYKYAGDLSLARVLADTLVRVVSTDVDAVIAMPLAPARLRERAFNQAQELARRVSSSLTLPLLTHACRKISDTAVQATLPFSARARNVRGAFVCDADLQGLRVAIVDDVMTTGATLNELARVLKRAGSVHVRGWVVARTLR
ncbi:MAG TPA: ComF family protein [Burkholderiales bacterium]|nr:ComF family protein [Burkholderiales bacterium]